jgi:hypothetical protein
LFNPYQIRNFYILHRKQRSGNAAIKISSGTEFITEQSLPFSLSNYFNQEASIVVSSLCGCGICIVGKKFIVNS